jgi:hypothetical protein
LMSLFNAVHVECQCVAEVEYDVNSERLA